jgi:hypothetical protein
MCLEEGVRLLEFETWSEFKQDICVRLFDEGVFNRGRYLFRGHRCADWRLTPVFHREYRNIELRDRPRYAELLIREFEDACEDYRVFPDAFPSSESEERNTAVVSFAQHYGLPTMLLDWSLSPYIAAFFAYNSVVGQSAIEDSGHVAIWVLDTASGIWEEHLGVSIIGPPRLSNARLRNQDGRFTLSKTPFETLEEYAGSIDSDQPALTRVLLPRDKSFAAISDLDAMGITPARLFPDYSGCVESAQLRLEMHLYHERVGA